MTTLAVFFLTLVRYNERDSRGLLNTFLFEGRYAPSRVPRGIPPEFVGRFLTERLEAGTAPHAFRAAAELMRFYEAGEVLPRLKQMLSGREADANDLLRSAYILAAIADLGTAQDASSAAAYFDRFLAVHAAVNSGLYPVFFDTLLAIAPQGSPARIFQRLAEETQKHFQTQYQSPADMFQYDTLSALERNDAHRVRREIARKTRLLAQSAAVRRAELIRIYAELEGAGLVLKIWAARMLRREVLDGNPGPVLAELERQLGAIDPKQQGAILFRIAQAIEYLGGALTPAQRELRDSVTTRTENFLSDV